MNFLLHFSLWTVALSLVLFGQGAQGSPSTDSPSTESSTLYPLTLFPSTGSSVLGKRRVKHPNPFDVLNMDQVRRQIRGRKWAYRPAKPYSITKFHFRVEEGVLKMTARYSMLCRGGHKRCRNCRITVEIPKNRKHYEDYVVEEFHCRV